MLRNIKLRLVGSKYEFYADDNRTCLQLTEQGSIESVHKIYDDFTKVSGLKINYSKSEALCINTSEETKNELTRHGITITNQAKCLGITLSLNIEDTINSTMENIDPKAIKKKNTNSKCTNKHVPQSYSI